jgi:hypothetical protein
MTKQGDKLDHRSPAFVKRQERWKHTGFLGSAKMMEMQCMAIMASSTATYETKVRASEICAKARDLYELLKERAA